jgi:hypothetical protein
MAPANPCPPSMPNEEQACASEGEVCSYGKCPLPGAEMSCEGHVWMQIGGGCLSGLGN